MLEKQRHMNYSYKQEDHLFKPKDELQFIKLI